jgi:hypothetical protein
LKFDEFDPPLIIDIDKKNKQTKTYDNFGQNMNQVFENGDF